MGLFNIIARLSLDSTQFDAGIKKADSSSKALAASIGRYFTAGAAAAAFTAIGRSALNAADGIANLADQIGITTDEVQMLQRAAQLSGNSIETYASALMRIKKLQADALSGDKGALASFSSLGIDPKSSPIQILSALGGATSPSQLSIVYDIIGTKSAKIKNSLKEIKELGPLELITAENVKALDDAGDALGVIMSGLKATTANLVGEAYRSKTGSLFIPWFLQVLRGKGSPAQTPETASETPIGGEFNWGRGLDWRYGRERRRREKEMIAMLNSPIQTGQFQSSSMNDRARIGGFFIGADATARMDIQRQQLQKQTVMADRIAKIEEQMRKLTEEE